MSIDFTTNVGKLRLRTADISDIPYLPDSVYTQVLIEQDSNLPRAAKVCATYILGQLAFRTHRRMSAQLEVWGAEAFANYQKYLLMIVKDPSFMDISPIPPNIFGTDLNPIIEFAKDWNLNFAAGTQSQQLGWDALGSPTSSTWQWNS